MTIVKMFSLMVYLICKLPVSSLLTNIHLKQKSPEHNASGLFVYIRLLLENDKHNRSHLSNPHSHHPFNKVKLTVCYLFANGNEVVFCSEYGLFTFKLVIYNYFYFLHKRPCICFVFEMAKRKIIEV